MKTKTLSTRHYKAGYEIRTQEVQLEGCGTHILKNAYTPEGWLIGSSKDAHRLCKKMGIKPEPQREDSNVCTIGFCEKDQRWYGWSHRCICSFGIGDKIFEDQYGDDTTPFVQHGNVPIKTLEDAKHASIAFAESVA